MSDTKIQRSIEEVIILASSVMMAVTITPFAFYRFFNGQYGAAFAELLSVMMMCAMGAYVWKTRNTKYMKVVVGTFMLVGLVVFNYILGSSILFWIYPIIMTVYFLNSLKVSLALVSTSILALLPLLIKEKTTVEVISIVVTLLICQMFGYLLSRKIREQYEIMEQLANNDGLTGALNRRAFDERIEFLYDLALRHKNNIPSNSLILFDLDNFKQINDEFGHLEGDKILINLTHLFKNKIRGIDQLYRYGGEEFVVIANGSDALKASELAEKMRLILESTRISDVTDVTASFGVAELQKRERPKRWIQRADDAMYRAKRAGKNRVFISNFEHETNDIQSYNDIENIKVKNLHKKR